MTGLPLQLDSSDPRALERAMRRYTGKPMINSVSAKAESMAAVFPLVKKYGGVVVGLALDEGGIPETAEGRVECAELIYDTAAEYGIAREDVVIDTLTLTVSSEPQAAQVTLEALGRIHDMGGHTILGVSNVSFGLPAREKINSAFLTLALSAGLDCAIMNPLSAAMMSAWRAFAVLTARDARCEDYIAHESNAEPPKPAAASGISLGGCIEKGLTDAASAEAKRLVAAGAEPLEVINSELIPALDRVGKGFEAGTLYLPQLLMSAEAAGAAFEALKSGMKGERGSEYPGRIVIATVRGDIHDIGKNIVRTLLENYGFSVTDLGKDVPPEAVLEVASAPDVRLVGLSALMTTTVASMAETIKLLQSRLPGIKIMVGGAVLNEEYAREIGPTSTPAPPWPPCAAPARNVNEKAARRSIPPGGVLFPVRPEIRAAHVLRHVLGLHPGEAVLVSVVHRLRVVPALEAQHVQYALQALYLRLHGGALRLKELQPLRIGRAPLHAPVHEALDVPYLQPRALEALYDPQRLYLPLAEAPHARGALHLREQPLLVIIPQRRDRQAEHLRHLAYRVHTPRLQKTFK